MSETKGKIGVFDSGFGGLSILKDIVGVLPQYDYVYLGDTARTPYGSRSQEVILEFTKQGVDFLFEHGAEIIILACNTASSEALRKIQQEYLPEKYPDKKVLGVIIPTAEEAVLETKNKKIGILATEATVRSCAFEREIKKINGQIEVFQIPAPLLVPIVEAGNIQTEATYLIVRDYVKNILAHDVDTIILGCTHYGILESVIKKYSGEAKIISEAPIIAKKLKEYLLRHSEIEGKLVKNNVVKFFTTDTKEKFDTLGSRFFGKDIFSNVVNITS